MRGFPSHCRFWGCASRLLPLGMLDFELVIFRGKRIQQWCDHPWNKLKSFEQSKLLMALEPESQISRTRFLLSHFIDWKWMTGVKVPSTPHLPKKHSPFITANTMGHPGPLGHKLFSTHHTNLRSKELSVGVFSLLSVFIRDLENIMNV